MIINQTNYFLLHSTSIGNCSDFKTFWAKLIKRNQFFIMMHYAHLPPTPINPKLKEEYLDIF